MDRLQKLKFEAPDDICERAEYWENACEELLCGPVELTTKQAEFLELFKAYRDKHGEPPSYADMAELMGTNKSNIAGYIDRLEERGHVRRLSGRSRSVMVVQGD